MPDFDKLLHQEWTEFGTHPGHMRKALKQAGSLSTYLKEISVYPLLSREQELALATCARLGDCAAIDRLVCSNLRFVVAVAKKYQHQGVSIDDLINEGNIGLMRAAYRFDETRGIKFISYAVWWIRQAIVESLARQSRIVRVPVGKISTIYQVGKRASALQQELGRDPTNREIADEMRIPEHEIIETMRLSRSCLSLDAPASGDMETRLFDLVPDDRHEAPDDPMLEDARSQAIAGALSQLTLREANVLSMYFGLATGEAMTLEAVGERLGVTRERVRQIRDKALARLRKGRQAAVLEAVAS